MPFSNVRKNQKRRRQILGIWYFRKKICAFFSTISENESKQKGTSIEKKQNGKYQIFKIWSFENINKNIHQLMGTTLENEMQKTKTI